MFQKILFGTNYVHCQGLFWGVVNIALNVAQPRLLSGALPLLVEVDRFVLEKG